MITKLYQQGAQVRSRMFALRHLLLSLTLVGLFVAACEADPMPTPEQEAPTPTPTTVQEQAPAALDEMRPDAPPYAFRGEFGVGYAPRVADAGSEDTLEVGSWYPALVTPGVNEAVSYPVAFKDVTWAPETDPVVFGNASRNAAVDDSDAPYPLVVLSHSFSGSTAGYSALAEHYASHGFVVLAPEHQEQFDPTFADLWKSLIDRPRDVKQTLDYAEELTAPGGAMAGLIDMENVAVVGHSYGGYTALAMAGAQYDIEAYNARCDQVGENDAAAFLCMALVPNEANMAARAGLDPMPDGLWPSFGDPRVTAIIPMAGDSYLFDEAGLAKITIPVMAMGGTADFGTPYDWGAKPSYDHASSDQKSLVGLVGAEHMIFATPCEDQPWMVEHPMSAYFCFDPVWDVERAQNLIHHLSTAFLMDTLKDDDAASAALLPEAVRFPGIEYTTTQ